MSRHAIVLAAGAGRRFGGGKLVAPWRGEPLIRRPVRTALAARVADVVVVLGSGREAVATALQPLADARLRVVVADDWSTGMAASLQAGLRALPESATSVCILLGDMPGVPAGLVDTLLDRIDAGAPAARPVHPDGPAHPVAFARSTFAQVMTLKGDAGARSVLQRLGDDLALVPIDDPGVVFDIDRPDDLGAAVSWTG